VPPHEFNVDFPHLLLRARAIDAKNGKVPFAVEQLIQTDRNGKLGALVAPMANWSTDRGNKLTRPIMEKVADVHREAKLPKFHGKTFALRAKQNPPKVNPDGPAKGRKAALFATCFVNYNNPGTGTAMQAVLAHLGVESKVAYPGCCGMPQLEQGEIAKVAEMAKKVARELSPLIDEGYDIVALMPSCALNLKFEWPLILPGDPLIAKLAEATFDATEYIVDIAKRHGLTPGLKPLDGGVSVHLACHARAQNMGPKAADLLRLIPGIDLAVIERCSGHGGSWGVMKENFSTALKVGRPVARTAIKNAKAHLASECPLAGEHIVQGAERLDEEGVKPAEAFHPVVLFARAYGLAFT
jgi:glycerol-3-phosphate dehydrogenase subunit C